MPERMWRHRPGRYNAAVTKYVKDEVQVVYVRHKANPSMLFVGAPWGPWTATTLKEDPDFELVRQAYLKKHPVPPPPPERGLTVYEWLRRPVLSCRPDDDPTTESE